MSAKMLLLVAVICGSFSLSTALAQAPRDVGGGAPPGEVSGGGAPAGGGGGGAPAGVGIGGLPAGVVGGGGVGPIQPPHRNDGGFDGPDGPLDPDGPGDEDSLSSASLGFVGGYYGPNYGASTAYGSYARGWADVVRSYGQYHLLNSLAARNFTKARSEQIENRYKYARTYFEMREMNRAYRAQLRGPRATEEELIRYAAAGAPDRLGPEELDPYTGEIQWPTLLRISEFDKQRQLIDQIFANRVLNSGRISADDYLILENSIEQMKALLKERIETVDPNEYVEAKSFLDSLDYEATA